MKKNLAKATALLLTAGMLGGTGLTAAASDVELNPGRNLSGSKRRNSRVRLFHHVHAER